MLRLTWEQFDRLEQLTLKRHAASISGVLAETWPALTERLGDRWPAFVEAAVQQGRKHGLRDAARPRALRQPVVHLGSGVRRQAVLRLGGRDPRRPAARRGAEAAPARASHPPGAAAAPGGGRRRAAAGAAPVLTTAQFESALAGVDARIGRLAAARSVFPSSEPAAAAVKACDLGAIDMMVAEAENLQEYRHTPQRLAAVRGRQASPTAP